MSGRRHGRFLRLGMMASKGSRSRIWRQAKASDIPSQRKRLDRVVVSSVSPDRLDIRHTRRMTAGEAREPVDPNQVRLVLTDLP